MTKIMIMMWGESKNVPGEGTVNLHLQQGSGLFSLPASRTNPALLLKCLTFARNKSFSRFCLQKRELISKNDGNDNSRKQ